MKLLAFLVIAVFSFPAFAQTPGDATSIKISNWIESNAPEFLRNDPAAFEAQMKEISPYFSSEGLDGYKDALVQSGWSKQNISYTSACVDSVAEKNGMWLAHAYMAMPEKAGSGNLNTQNIYYIDEADLMVYPPRAATVFDLQVLKTHKQVMFQEVNLGVSVDPATQEPKIERVIYGTSKSSVPEKCAQGPGADEQINALQKVKARFESDIKLIDQKIVELQKTKETP